jgi:hypothetical protein
VHVTKVLAAVSFYHDMGLERRRIFSLPEEEFLAVALETDLYEHNGMADGRRAMGDGRNALEG